MTISVLFILNSLFCCFNAWMSFKCYRFDKKNRRLDLIGTCIWVLAALVWIYVGFVKGGA